MPDFYILAAIVLVMLVTMLDRGLPYLLFRGKKALPAHVEHLGNVLPCAIMIILVIYCLRNIDFSGFPYGLAELISVALVILLQLWKSNTVLSIALGTACYMVLIRTVF